MAKSLCVELSSGEIVYIRPMSLGKRAEFGEYCNSIFDFAMSHADSDISFAELYDSNKRFRHLCEQAISLCNLSRDLLDIDDLYAMLMPHTDADGLVHPNGLLIEQNFTKLKTNSVNAKGNPATFADTLAMLWHLQTSLKEALEVAYDERLPADVLLDTLDAIGKLRNPEAWQKNMLQNKAMDSILARQASGQLDSFEEVADVDYPS